LQTKIELKDMTFNLKKYACTEPAYEKEKSVRNKENYYENI
jgi:hypothetical protein